MPDTRQRSLSDEVERALRDGDLDAARAAAGRAGATAADARERAGASLLRARCDYVAGDLAAALPLALEAAAGAAASGDAGLEASARALLARCQLGAGDTADALEHAVAAVRLADAVDAHADTPALERPRLVARTALGVVHLGLEQLEPALHWCQRAVESAQRLGDAVALGAATDTVACVLSAMAARERAAGRAAEAERLERQAIRDSTEAVRIAREQGHREYEATALNNLAESMSLVGEAEQALVLLAQWAERQPALPPRVRGHHFDTRGMLCLGLGRPPEACRWFQQALEVADDVVSRMVACEHLATALEQCGQWQAALQRYKEFHALQQQVAAQNAQRSARIAEVRLETERARARADELARRNQHLHQRAEDLQRLSATDGLTGLANRRQLDMLLDAGVGDGCVVLLDVDLFKRVNDTHSHAVGDEVLRRISGLLRDTCRAEDTPGRLGGEEFVVLMRGLTLAAGAGAAERLRSGVAALDWGAVAPGLAVTVSIGVAHGSEAGGGRAVLALADRRLYVAKQGGRDRVVSG